MYVFGLIYYCATPNETLKMKNLFLFLIITLNKISAMLSLTYDGKVISEIPVIQPQWKL